MTYFSLSEYLAPWALQHRHLPMMVHYSFDAHKHWQNLDFFKSLQYWSASLASLPWHDHAVRVPALLCSKMHPNQASIYLISVATISSAWCMGNVPSSAF